MRFLTATALLALPLLYSCAPATPPRSATPQNRALRAVMAPPNQTLPAITPQFQSPPESLRLTTSAVAGITFEGVAFDSRKHRLVVADQANGPGSEFADASAAGSSRGGIAAINAGFFTPEGAPLGLVISAGKSSGAWNSASSLGSGVWHSGAIVRREAIGRSGASAIHELVQAGPMLVENGRAISGLNPVKSSARSFIIWDGGTRWWIGRSSPCSLADLGKALAVSSPARWKIKNALNLDGGRSADFWVSGQVAGGPMVRRAPWNRPVRNFLILLPQGA